MDIGKTVPFVLRTLNVFLALNVHVLRNANFNFVVTLAPFVFLAGHPEKKGVCSDAEAILIKPVKDASFVDLSPSAPPVTNVLSCSRYSWQVLAAKGLSPRAVLILKEGYCLKFNIKPPLASEPLIRSGHVNPLMTAT